MFTTGIFINEYHLDFKTTTTGNKTTKAPVAIGFSTALMPKPEPVSNPPASETVDAGLGPKPDPIPRPLLLLSYSSSAGCQWWLLAALLFELLEDRSRFTL
jgi:hypothetical protein